MANDTEQKPVPQSLRREISRRPVVVGLIGLAVAEAVAGGITWKVLSQGLSKIALAFAPPVPTHTSLSSGATLYTYRGHSSVVNAVKWSPDNKRIVSGSDDQTAQVWDATTGGHVLTYLSQTGAVLTVTWSPDGKCIALAGGAQAPTPTPTLTPTPPLVPTPTPTLTPTPPLVPTPTSVPPILSLTLIISPSSLSFSAFLGRNNTLSQILTLTNGSSTSTNWTAKSENSWLSISPASGNLPPMSSQTITVVISSVGLSRGSYGATITFSDGVDTVSISIVLAVSLVPTVGVWELTTGRTLLAYSGHKDFVNAVAWSPNGKYIASGSSDTTVQIWDATTGGNVLTHRGHYSAVRAVAWSPSGTRIASGSSDTTVQIWDATTGKHINTYTGHSGAVNSLAWSPNGKYIASGSSDTTVQIWDATTGKPVFTYTHHSSSVNTIAWASDGTRIASAGDDTTVQVWKAF